jgi:hypothetical protein
MLKNNRNSKIKKTLILAKAKHLLNLILRRKGFEEITNHIVIYSNRYINYNYIKILSRVAGD